MTVFDERHRIAFGCAGLGGLFHPVSEEEADALLDTAYEAGIRYFDTAPHYGNGMSEHRLGDFLRGRKDWLLSTKVGRILSPDPAPPAVVNGFHNALPLRQHFDFSYDGIMRSVEASYNRLGLNRIDILYVHDIGDAGAGTDTEEYRTQFLKRGGARALYDLKRQGVVQAVGLGVNTVGICLELMDEMPMDAILLAGRYTLLDRTAETGLLDASATRGIRIVIGGVFNSGILATGPLPGAHFDYEEANEVVRGMVAEIERVCARHDTPMAAAALQFPSRAPEVASVLIGTTRPSSLKRNLDLLTRPVPDALWADLEGVRTIVGRR